MHQNPQILRCLPYVFLLLINTFIFRNRDFVYQLEINKLLIKEIMDIENVSVAAFITFNGWGLLLWISHIHCSMIVRQTVPSLFSPGPSDSFTLDVLVSLLRQENAADICVIKVPDQVKYAEYFIVVTGTSQRHLRAMALYAIKVVMFFFSLLMVIRADCICF